MRYYWKVTRKKVLSILEYVIIYKSKTWLLSKNDFTLK
jgi:hypothetical protein